MAVMDFPSNPSDGQVSGNFVWSASTGAWKAKPQLQQTVTQSPLVPANPNVGDIWMNTNLGISFTYYDDGTSKQWIEMVSSAVPAVNTIMPSGTIVQTARATAPDYWLFCDGSAISRTTYSTLYAAIGTQYGSGDGSTTFNLPNLQGRVPVGKNSSGTFAALGGTGGAETVTLDSTQIPSHTHPITDNGHYHNTYHHHTVWDHSHGQVITANSGGPGIRWDYRQDGSSYTYPQGVNTNGNGAQWTSDENPQSDTKTTGITVNGQSGTIGQAHTNLQPYLILNYMIKV